MAVSQKPGFSPDSKKPGFFEKPGFFHSPDSKKPGLFFAHKWAGFPIIANHGLLLGAGGGDVQ
ncbi:hypothetical protein B9S53_13215 [Arthrospira sp. O9.13F]|nr:hypothetical protein B9S53_13215 [Arthrospira sp. O9.13F]